MSNLAFAFFVGVDWGSESHEVCVLDASRKPVRGLTVAHTADGLHRLRQQLWELAPAATIAVAIESPSSPATEPLLDAGFTVFSINPKQLDRFRDRFYPAGAKDDRKDALVLASALSTDQACFRKLDPEDPQLSQLRALSRLDQVLKADRVAYCNRLRDVAVSFFPDLLRLCPAANEAWFWGLLQLAPAAPKAARVSLSRLRALLRRHRIRRFSAEDLQAVLRRPLLPLPAASFQRGAAQIQGLLPVLLAVDAQQRQLTTQIEACLVELGAPSADDPADCQHRDVNILLSLPGVGITVAAAMLSEAHRALANRDYHALRAHAGVAPITRQSGKSTLISLRRACNRAFRNAVYHWGRVSVMCDAHSKAHYARLRQKGHSHGRALRGVADRLLKLLCSMLTSRTLYDPARRQPQAAAAA